MVWIGRESNKDVVNWGWKLENNHLVPIVSDMNATPDKLQNMLLPLNTTLQLQRV